MPFEEFSDFLDDENAGKSKRAKIAVVDDDRGILDSLYSLLSEVYEVITCPDGPTAVSVIDDSFDAVVLDVRMEPKNGFWVYERVREKCPELPIIFNSAYQGSLTDGAVVDRYMPFAYLTKGSDPQQLIKTISDAVEKHRRMREQRDRLRTIREKMKTIR